MEIDSDKYEILKEAYLFKKEVEKLQVPLCKSELRELRQLVKQNFKEGQSNYLRLISLYNDQKDVLLNIYVRDLLNKLRERINND
jgi:septal ring factor EnvC (AmiA/AmiB activator)